MADRTSASAPLIAAYDQTRANGDELLDQLLSVFRDRTSGHHPAQAALTLSMLLPMYTEDARLGLLNAAILRLLEQGTGDRQ